MKRTLKFLIPAFCATSAFAFNITPFLTCVAVDAATASTTAYFGYESAEQSLVTIPVGTDNRIIPDPPNQNQPTLFLPGYFEKAFRVTFPSASAVFWSFNGFAIPANSLALPCPATAGAPLPLALPPAMVLVPYSQQLTAIGRQAAITWSALSSLPTGLTLSPGGLLSGTPQTGGQTFITLQATDGFTTSQRTYGLLVGNGVTINDAVSTRPPGFTPEFRVVTNVATTVNAIASCDLTEFVITGGGGCAVPNSNTVMGRVAASGPASNGWQVTCSGGTAIAVAVCSKQ